MSNKKWPLLIRSVAGIFVGFVLGCAHPPSTSVGGHPPMAAAAGITRADNGKTLRDGRIIPLDTMSGDVQLLYGDPEVPDQAFVMRIHELPGSIVPPHSHPVDEHITVVQGTWHFGFGESFDSSKLKELKAGGYAFAPKGSSMFAASPDGAIVQVHGVGPFLIHWHGGLHTLDDQNASAVFKFVRGAMVNTPRGPGRIVQGYASGQIVQYELEAADGSHFMADQATVSAR